MAGTKKEQTSRLRIIVSAFESKALDRSVAEIIKNIDKLGAEIKGPVPLPTKTKRWTINRSSFVYEESKEQYEMKVHRRLIDIINPDQKVVTSLTNLSLPSGINVDVKML